MGRITTRCVGYSFGLVLGCMVTVPVGASEVEQRLERLEAQVKQLMERIEAQDKNVPLPATGAPRQGVPAARAPAPMEASPSSADTPGMGSSPMGEVRLRYFVGGAVMGAEPPSEAPVMQGLYTLQDGLRFDPGSYGIAEGGMLARYGDRNLYRAAGILIEGLIHLPAAGTYEFEVAPKPAREGGGSPVANEMTVRLHIAGEPVIEMDAVRSWGHQTYRHELPSGQYSFELWTAASSPGYGPSPLDSRLEIQVGVPGRAGLVALSQLLTAGQ